MRPLNALVAVEAMRNAGSTDVVISVPTGNREAIERVAPRVEAIYCANVRSGRRFAVADAYHGISPSAFC